MIGRQLQSSRDTVELTALLPRLWHNPPQEVIGNLTDLITRRVSVCIAAREWRQTALLVVTVALRVGSGSSQMVQTIEMARLL
ncbi:hypothetical protein TNCV_5049601 [Trichonephila clavipes]|nr:hypothetical protein TNCV_5049601 [Trichonephila clavipes]